MNPILMLSPLLVFLSLLFSSFFQSFLSPVLRTFLPSLATNLSSTNPQIRQLCQSSIDTLLTSLETPISGFTRDVQTAIVAPFAQVWLFENGKIPLTYHPWMLEKITAVLAACAEACEATGQQPTIATFKPAIPIAYSLCEETRAEIKAPLLKCAQTIYNIIGAQLWDEKVCMQLHISNQQVTKIKQMINI